MRRFYVYCFLLLFAACKEGADKPFITKQPAALIPPKAIGEILLPDGYTRTAVETGSFAAWLRTVPLKKDKTVYLYNGKLKPNQSAQFAVIDIPTGTKDLQQCADAVMRLRAEYLFSEGKTEGIAFMDYNNNWYRWTGGPNRIAFEKYLEHVFGWCGSASLEKQLKPVPSFNTIQAGDVLIKGGFPGHAMTVMDIAVNEKGHKIFLLAQGYQPAQDIHVVLNPGDQVLSPWYAVNENAVINTPEWQFSPKNLKRW